MWSDLYLGPYYHFDHDHGHGHDHDEPDDLSKNGLWIADNFQLYSVGVDIGSAGTQVMFSRLHLQRRGQDLTSRYVVVLREPLFQSEVALTPYLKGGRRIDGEKLGRIIAAAYAEAKVTPPEIDTGAVILTGEAIRRENAQAVARALSAQCGEFVCVAAGHHMEALLAAYGSGAALRSHTHHSRILNIDIGGGTTKLSLVENGKVIDTAALHVGGRLLAHDRRRRITRLEPGARAIAAEAGVELRPGAAVTDDQLDRMAHWMAAAVLAAVSGRPVPPEVAGLLVTEPLKEVARIDGVMFSGGVGEYVYGREHRDFGDLGRRLGLALRRLIVAGELGWPLLPPGECIRATVVGASEHTVQVSGNTLYLSDPGLLPRRNLQAINPGCDLSGEIDPTEVAARIRGHVARLSPEETHQDLALAFAFRGDPDYPRLRALCEGIVTARAEALTEGRPLILVFEGDIARTVGLLLQQEFGVTSGIVALDGIYLQDFDFIDLGRKLEPSGTVPVTVKSLLFHFAQGGEQHRGDGPEASAG